MAGIMLQNIVIDFPLFNMHCIDPKCVNITNSPDADTHKTGPSLL